MCCVKAHSEMKREKKNIKLLSFKNMLNVWFKMHLER